MPSPAPDSTDGRRTAAPLADRAALIHDALVPVMLSAAVLFALLPPLELVVHPGAEGRWLAAVATGLSVFFAAARAACVLPSVERWVRTHADLVGMVVSLVASLHGFGLLLITRQPAAAGSVVLFVVVAGALAPVRRYAMVVVGVSLAQWFLVAADEGFRGEWGLVTVLVLCASVLAQVLWTARCRTADSLAAAQAAVLEAAMTDEMTGLTNRRGLLAAGRAVLTPDRDPQRPVALLLLDLDGLKIANDRYGHAAGDSLVRSRCCSSGPTLRRPTPCGTGSAPSWRAEASAPASASRRRSPVRVSTSCCTTPTPPCTPSSRRGATGPSRCRVRPRRRPFRCPPRRPGWSRTRRSGPTSPR